MFTVIKWRDLAFWRTNWINWEAQWFIKCRYFFHQAVGLLTRLACNFHKRHSPPPATKYLRCCVNECKATSCTHACMHAHTELFIHYSERRWHKTLLNTVKLALLHTQVNRKMPWVNRIGGKFSTLASNRTRWIKKYSLATVDQYLSHHYRFEEYSSYLRHLTMLPWC